MQTLNLVICASSEGLLARLLAELSSMPSVYRIERFPSPANSTSYSATSPPQLQPPTPHPSAATEYAERTPNAVAFAHAARRFLVQHSEQPERAMRALVAGVAGLDVAILVVSGSAELDTRTRTLAYLSGQLGVRHVVFGVDLTGLGADCKKRFIEIADACNALATQCGLVASVTVPLFTDRDTNVLIPCALVPDYQGTSLHAHLQGLALGHRALASLPLRICVQTVEPSDDAHLTVTGTVLTGHARVGERVRVQPGGYELAIENVIPQSANDRTDSRDESVAITLRGQAAIAHGSVISSIESPAQVADQFQATVVWMGQAPLLRGRSYILRTPADAVQATVAPLKYMINPRTFEHVAAERLECWEVGVCELELDRPVVFDPFAENPCTGSFTLADPITHEEVGAGILQFALRRAHNVHIHGLAISRYMRAHQKTQKPCILWLTGLSGSGKSTIANEIDKQLHAMGRHAYILDGDNVRHGLTKDLGFTAQDRVENIRRIAEVAKLMADAGLIVLTAFISPFRSERHMARNLMLPGEFIEIFVDTPLALAESRDPKGLYKKARRGEIKNFTGLDSPYEAPDAPEIRLHTASLSPQEAANQVIEYLRHAGSFDAP